MNDLFRQCRAMTDDELEASTKNVCAVNRRAIVELLVHLAVLDERELAQRKAYPSLFLYCTKALGFSEDEAVARIAVARIGSRYHVALHMLADGKLTLKALYRLSGHLNNDNHLLLLESAAGKSREELERFIASIAPRPDIRDHIQRMPVADRQQRMEELLRSQPPAGSPPPPPEAGPPLQQPALAQSPRPGARDVVEYLSPNRLHFGFTGSEELNSKIKRAKQLLWHRYPQGHLEDIVGAAMDLLLDAHDPDRQREPRKTEPSGESTRYIPKWVRAEVWKRDAGCCSFTTSDGVRCQEKAGLEYDHRVPFANGGSSDDPANIRLLCRAHNQLLARDAFGDKADRRQRDGAS